VGQNLAEIAQSV